MSVAYCLHALRLGERHYVYAPVGMPSSALIFGKLTSTLMKLWKVGDETRTLLHRDRIERLPQLDRVAFQIMKSCFMRVKSCFMHR